jgi:cytoskeletal protein RodZ
MPDRNTVGRMLKTAREDKGLSHAEVYTQTRILPELQIAMENGNFSHLGDEYYIQAFIRLYSQFLSIDPEKSLALYRREYKPIERAVVKRKLTRMELLEQFVRLPQVRLGAAAVFIAALTFVLLAQITSALQPPQLNLSQPRPVQGPFTGEVVVVGNSFRISGNATPGAKISINGSVIDVDSTGSFDTPEIPLTGGAATAIVTATTNLGRSTEISLQIVKGGSAAIVADDMNAIIEVVNQDTELTVRSDGVIKLNQQVFAGDVFNISATNRLQIDTPLPASFKVQINGEEFTLAAGTNLWQLVDGQAVKQEPQAN